MKAELEKSLDVDVELIEGGGGVFDVRLDGELIYSKRDVGRFPAPGEIAQLVQSKH